MGMLSRGGHGHGYRGHGAAAKAVVGLVGEAIGADIAGVGSVNERAVGVDGDRAVTRRR